MTLDDPCIIRMDVHLTAHVDLVADVHALPFLPESLDYIFSLAVVEHLRNPFRAAQAMYEALKDGGYVYHECNFVFSYHGYPHHYFNASSQGLEQVFAAFTPLRTGVAPYQMPSFTLEMVLGSYLRHSRADEFAHGRRLTTLLRAVLEQDLRQHDIYFSEPEAFNVAAGTYLAGMKQSRPGASLVPGAIRAAWEADEALRLRFPAPDDLTTTANLLLWAKEEGRRLPAIASCLDAVRPFNKRGASAPFDRTAMRGLSLTEPTFSTIGFDPGATMSANSEEAERRFQAAELEASRRRAAEAEAERRRLAAEAAARSLLRRGLRRLGLAGVLATARRYLTSRGPA
jgi:SAM-dependent methyltransferase